MHLDIRDCTRDGDGAPMEPAGSRGVTGIIAEGVLSITNYHLRHLRSCARVGRHLRLPHQGKVHIRDCAVPTHFYMLQKESTNATMDLREGTADSHD